MIRAHIVDSASLDGFRAFCPCSHAPADRNAAHGLRTSAEAHRRRFTSSAKVGPSRDHALDLVVRLDGAQGEGPSPAESPTAGGHRIAQRREASNAIASSTGRQDRHEHRIVEAPQHATTAGAQHVTAGPHGCRDGAALASGDAENISASCSRRLDGRDGPWAARLARVLGGPHTALRSAAPGFFTISGCFFGL